MVLVGTFGMAPLLKTNFFDQGEQEVLTLKQELKPGTSLAATDAQAKKVEKLLADVKGVKDYQVTIGSSGFMAAFGGGTDTNQASYQVMLEDSASATTSRQRIEEGLGKLSGIGTTTIAAGDGFGSQDLSVVVKAADADVLRKASEQVRDDGRRPRRRHRRPERPVAERAAHLGQGQLQGGGGRFRPADARRGGRRGGPRHHGRQGDPGRHRAGRRHQVGRSRPRRSARPRLTGMGPR